MSRYSNSEVNEFSRCPLSYFYKYQKRLRRIDEAESSIHHTSYGTAGHKAMEVLYTENSVKRAQQAFRDYYPVQLDPTDLAKTADNACFTIAKYWEHYDADKNWEVVAVEGREFTADGFGIKPDLVVRENGNILVVDHKWTGAYLNYDWFSAFDPNSQVTQYIRWCKEAYGACDGFVVNAIATRFRQRTYKGEAAGFWCAFERQQFNRTTSQIENTVRSADEVIEDIERAKERGFWRAAEHKQACHYCSFKSLCSSGWSWDLDQELILTTFRQVCDQPVSATDEHCALDEGHSGPHSSAIQSPASSIEFEVEV